MYTSSYVQSVELTNEAIDFLSATFNLYDDDHVCLIVCLFSKAAFYFIMLLYWWWFIIQFPLCISCVRPILIISMLLLHQDGALRPRELEELFSTAPVRYFSSLRIIIFMFVCNLLVIYLWDCILCICLCGIMLLLYLFNVQSTCYVYYIDRWSELICSI